MADPFIKELACYLSFDGGADGSGDFSAATYTAPWFSKFAAGAGPVGVVKKSSPTYSTLRSRFGASSLRVQDPNSIWIGTGPRSSPSPVTRPPGGAITFEGWFWFDSTSDCRIMGCIAGNTGSTECAWGLGISAGKLRLSVISTQVGVGTTTISSGAWHHIACVQETGFGHRVYLDGNLEISGGGRYVMGEAFEIGTYLPLEGFTSAGMSGYISEVVVTFAVKYRGSSFGVPTAPLDLTGLPTFTNAGLATRIGSKRNPLFIGVSVRPTSIARQLRDMQHGGRGVIASTVKEKSSPVNLPLRRRVVLHRERDSMAIRETWSDPITGAYSFVGIDEKQRYYVIAIDHERNYRAVIADNLTPTVP